MDMRDTWTVETRLHEDMASPLWFWAAERDEARCVSRADLVVMNTPLAAQAMEAKWPGRKMIAVMNGWDQEPLIEEAWPDQFRIVYAGSIYIDRTPMPSFRAAADVIRQLRLSPAEFEIRLIGSVDEFAGQSVAQLAEQAGIQHYVRLLPAMPRTEVLREYAQAAVLLSLPQGLRYAIPSKVFEYLRLPAWVMVQADAGSASAHLLRGSKALVVDPLDVGRMTELLLQCYREFKSGHRPEPLARDGRWSRAGEGAKLFEALESLVPRG
jgi:hypothetical protein